MRFFNYFEFASLVVAVTCAWAPSVHADVVGGSGLGEFEVFMDVAEMGPLMGVASFDEGPLAGPVPLDTYAAAGLVFRTGSLLQILPGSNDAGVAPAPQYGVVGEDFPSPILGSGDQTGQVLHGGAVATFTADVTQVGLIMSSASKQTLSVWDKEGLLIVELVWNPSEHASFVGLDTRGRPIGMVAVGNDEILGDGPATYTPEVGPAIATDTWVWSAGFLCVVDADCDDASVCSGSESCVDGYCVKGAPLECESEDMCVIDSCDPVNGCVHEKINNCCEADADCPDGQLCVGGACQLPAVETTGEHGESSGGESTSEGVEGTGETSTSGAPVETSTGDAPVETSTGDAPSEDGSSDAGETSGEGPDGGSTGVMAPTSGGAGESSTGGAPEATSSDAGCGCASSGEPAGLLALVSLALRRRRR